MRKIGKLILASFLAASFSISVANADVAKGQKWYLSKIKSVIHIKGDKFTSMHSSYEWESLFEGDGSKFVAWAKDKWSEPKFHKFLDSAKFKNKYMKDIKDFCIHYANDSGQVPSC